MEIDQAKIDAWNTRAAGEAAGAPVVTQAWEAFCDHSYYDMWCVRKVGDRTFGQGFHVMRQDEAYALRDLLNTLPTSKEEHQ